ncbi:putative exo-1 [Diplonema papillatum]|nr:putative exo-1 [Diplonema papillatum]
MCKAPAAVLLLAVAVLGDTVPITTETMDTRACPTQSAHPWCDTAKSRADRINSLIAALTDEEIRPMLTARSTQGAGSNNVSRLGLPAYDWGLNCVHGVQSTCVQNATTKEVFCPTSFPMPSTLGASWNQSTWKEFGRIMGMENRALWLAGAHEQGPVIRIGLDCWSPNINLNHDPRWGRNQEVASEDPFINGLYGAAVTNGEQVFEGSPYIMSVPTIKHWDAYSLEDSDNATRHTFNAIVDNATLSDAYFPAWKNTVQLAGAKGVMCSYNALNGVPTCANPFLRHVMRDVWNFTGYVTSDTEAISCIYSQHHYVDGPTNATLVAMRDGECDINSGSVYESTLVDGLASGVIPRSLVNRALFNSLGIRFDLGLFDPVEDQPLWHIPITEAGSAANIAQSKFSTMESMVLLKNEDNTLPLPKGKKIAVVGPHYNATRMMVGNYYGQICPSNNFDCVVSPKDGIKDANTGGSVMTAMGCSISGNSTSGFDEALSIVEQADIVVMMMGIDQTVEGEAHDRTTIGLPGVQIPFILNVTAKAKSLGKPAVLVLLHGSWPSLGPVLDAPPPAIVDSFYPGIYGAPAIAATLFGDNDHLGGKLPFTAYPADYADQIRMDVMGFNTAGTPGRSHRYYTGPVEFPFGHGLSYTTFEMAMPKPASTTIDCDDSGSMIQLSYEVQNIGKVTGDEVIMIFRTNGMTGSTGLPLVKKLIGFERVHLAPGEVAKLKFTVDRSSVTDVTDAGDRVCSPSTNHTIVATNGVTMTIGTPISVTSSSGSSGVVIAKFPDVSFP